MYPVNIEILNFWRCMMRCIFQYGDLLCVLFCSRCSTWQLNSGSCMSSVTTTTTSWKQRIRNTRFVIIIISQISAVRPGWWVIMEGSSYFLWNWIGLFHIMWSAFWWVLKGAVVINSSAHIVLPNMASPSSVTFNAFKIWWCLVLLSWF